MLSLIKKLFLKSQKSLIPQTIFEIAVRVTAVISISAIVSYSNTIINLELQTQEKLKKYINERGQRESIIFKLAQDNLVYLSRRFTQELDRPVSKNIDSEFNRRYFRWKDGTIRNFPQNRSLREFDTNREPTVFIGRNVRLTGELKQRLSIAYDLIRSYGSAWSNRFIDLYFTTPENTDINYWKGTPRNLEAKPDLYAPNEEYFYVGTPDRNPSRKPVWTGLYLDVAVNKWMVSAIVPVYYRDRFLGIIGHDVILTELMKNTLYDSLPGAYNLIVRADGRLIAHPQKTEAIQKAGGQLDLNTISDPGLQQIFQTVQNLGKQNTVIERKDDFLGVTRIEGPDWYLVTVYPKSLLFPRALNSAKISVFMGIIALLTEIILLYTVLKRKIAHPLEQLTDASNLLSDGSFNIHLDTNRQDEIGQLANSFQIMATQLQNSYKQLEQSNSDLEERVATRTMELNQAMQDLKQTQAQMIQGEKLSSLGQMVAGIAHEINNPIGFIHGNITYLEEYTKDLLYLIELYQKYYPNPHSEIQTETEAIDPVFLQQDLIQVLQSMKNGTIRIKEIILSLRSFSRLDEAEIKQVDIHEGIESILTILNAQIKSQVDRRAIEIVKQYGELPLVECNPASINQVFMNILVNAIEALDESRRMVVKALNPDDIPQIWIQTQPIDEMGDRYVAIIIKDNGIGISSEVQSKLFDPFFTTKPIGQGTGLGLFVSYQVVVDKHGGTLKIRSQPGQVTEFEIRIPVRANSSLNDSKTSIDNSS